MSSKGKKTKKEQLKQQELIKFVVELSVIALAIIAMFELGVIGRFLNQCMRVLAGQYPMPYHILIIGITFYKMIDTDHKHKTWRFWTAVGLLFTAMILAVNFFLQPQASGLSVISEYFNRIPKIFMNSNENAYGGVVGAVLFGLLSYLVDRAGVLLFVIVLILSGLALLFTPREMLRSAQKSTDATKSAFEKRREQKEAKQREKAVHEKQIELDEKLKDYASESEPTKAEFISFDPPISSLEPSSKTPFMTMDESIDTVSVDPVDEVENPFGLENAGLDPVSLSDKTSTQEALEKGEDFRTSSFENYKIPSIHLLEAGRGSNTSKANVTSAKEKGDRLIAVLKQFGIDAALMDIHIGPAVTKFELKPDSNVKISRIASIQDNLMMELAVKTLRIEAPIPGKSAVGIEIPNVEMVPVKMKDVVMGSSQFMAEDNINVALGKDLTGKPITVALNKMPHLLVAGATGSGKSVCMNTIITSILLTKSPEDLKLLLIDPKKVEFTPYTEIPHLIGPVIDDPHKASAALKVVVEEMEQRYDLFSKAGVRNIGSYNEKVKAFPAENLSKLPWIVVIIDELADLMSVAGKEVETSIQRITQLARAAGIHLIVATQRPSVDVVTGIIKANIPSRIAFAVSSAIDSRTILDETGAEKLLGYGDMLYVPMGEPHAIRVQGCYVSDDEVKKIADKASSQAKPRFDDSFIKLDGVDGNQGVLGVEDDPLYQEALEYVVRQKKASTSLLQRRFRIGYNRAANIVDSLEQNGVIGPAQGSKPRDVYIKLDDIEQESAL
ncbi:DNA translocase FtsK [Erysipelothrix rhusiopathiae]|nr:DNA translocase FtsK [Erysipelothrix rhusiopathiae]